MKKRDMVLVDTIPKTDPAYPIVMAILRVVPASRWAFARPQSDGELGNLLGIGWKRRRTGCAQERSLAAAREIKDRTPYRRNARAARRLRERRHAALCRRQGELRHSHAAANSRTWSIHVERNRDAYLSARFGVGTPLFTTFKVCLCVSTPPMTASVSVEIMELAPPLGPI